jgi:hypothetical protein
LLDLAAGQLDALQSERDRIDDRIAEHRRQHDEGRRKKKQADSSPALLKGRSRLHAIAGTLQLLRRLTIAVTWSVASAIA